MKMPGPVLYEKTSTHDAAAGWGRRDANGKLNVVPTTVLSKSFFDASVS